MSLNNACLVIEGAMRLHNFLVDFRDSHIENYNIEKQIFQDNIRDANEEPLQVGSDLGRPAGRSTHANVVSRTQGLLLRNQLCNALALHDMHRPERKEWFTDLNTHVQRID